MKNKGSNLVLTGIASLFLAGSAHATLIGTTGDGEIIAPPVKVLNGQVFNTHQQGFNEKQGVVLASNLLVDDGSDAGTAFDIIPAGTIVDSHMIFLNQKNVEGQDPQLNDLGIVWTFDGPILGVMSDNDGTLEAASSSFLGSSSTQYPAAGFNNRGFENNDSYTISGNTLTVNMHVTQPGDWIRVVTQHVPDAGSTMPLLALAVGSLALIRRKILA